MSISLLTRPSTHCSVKFPHLTSVCCCRLVLRWRWTLSRSSRGIRCGASTEDPPGWEDHRLTDLYTWRLTSVTHVFSMCFPVGHPVGAVALPQQRQVGTRDRQPVRSLPAQTGPSASVWRVAQRLGSTSLTAGGPPWQSRPASPSTSASPQLNSTPGFIFALCCTASSKASLF